MPRKRGRAIPYDLLKDASRRVGILSLLSAVLWVLGTLGSHIASMAMNDPRWAQLQITDTIAAVSVAVSLALYFYTRGQDRNPKLILDLGLVYMVLMALALGLEGHCSTIQHGRPVLPEISWIGVVALMFAAIVPNAPRKTLVAGLFSASMNPISMLLSKAQGLWDFGPASNALLMHYPDYLLVGVSVVISHVVTKLGEQVTKAREMGSYRLITMLGKGGMGEVWLARHRMLARDAAIKLIKPEMLSHSSGDNAVLVQRRFEQEAKATAFLRSPHTVELYDFGVTEDGVFYYVMELLDGIDLETLVQRFGPQPAARVVSILRQVCRSLADAHRNGMVHRDIKPSNIFLCRMGSEFDYVKVLDFGLVKVMDSDDTQMTRDGGARGTPAYMAPELALGTPQIDGRTDLYGLGCVAYFLLTGGLVFDEIGATAMMLAHLQKVPDLPSARSALAVPASLDRVIMMCLEKGAAERPVGARMLERLLDGCDDAGIWSQEAAETWWRTNIPGEFALNDEKTESLHSDQERTRTL